jgi:hypothetical protein
MSLFPTVIQTQPAFAIDAIQKSNSAYYFIPTDGSGGGGGSTSNLVSPVTVTTAGASAGITNGITVNSDNTNNFAYGYAVKNAADGEVMVALVAEGDGAVLQIGNAGAANAYFSSNQTQSVIGNTDSSGTATTLISWTSSNPALTLTSPVTVVTQPSFFGQNGITVQSNQFDSIDYGYFVNDVSSGSSLIQLFAQGDVGQLILGDQGGANNAYFVSGQGGTAIGNETTGTATNMILWNPTDPALTLKLKNPTVITGPSGEGIIYDSVYHPPPPPSVPIITSPSAPTIVTTWSTALAVTSNIPYTVPTTGLYLVTTAVTISVGVGYSFPIGSVLNLTPKVQGTDDPFISHTYFLSTTGPQGNITTTQQGLGFYTAGAIIIGQLNQASTGIINLGPSGGCQLLIQQVINQYP